SQAFYAEALERVGRRTRFIRTTPEEANTLPADAFSDRKGLLAAFYRARSRNDRELLAADRRIASGEFNDRVVQLNVAADQLVRLGDAYDLLYAGHFIKTDFDNALVSGDADRGALSPGDRMGAITKRFDLFANRANLF